jgi:hypothetical protein
MPALKISVVGVPKTPLPKRSAHRPLTLIGLPSLLVSVPSSWPVRGS